MTRAPAEATRHAVHALIGALRWAAWRWDGEPLLQLVTTEDDAGAGARRCDPRGPAGRTPRPATTPVRGRGERGEA